MSGETAPPGNRGNPAVPAGTTPPGAGTTPPPAATSSPPVLPGRIWSRVGSVGSSLVASARGLAFFGLMLAGAGLVVAVALPVILAVTGISLLFHHRLAGGPLLPTALILAGLAIGPFLTPGVLPAIRELAMLTRRLSGEWCGVPIADPYRPPPASTRLGYWGRLRWLLGDPAGRRDLLWFAVNACAGWLLAAAPAGLTGYGLLCLYGANRGHPVVSPPPGYPGSIPPMLIVLGAACIALGLWAAPWLLRGYGLMARSVLAPSGQAELRLRVAHLAQARADTLDTGAAELRRIERDLHDGAQARLVAMGMTLDAAGQLLDHNPEAARELLAEARESSAKALAELRDLVRGIHPPVLADRGLAEAVRALALDLPLRVHCASELDGRPPAPVESAAYFAVSELLANVSKHADARQAWIDIRHSGGVGGMGDVSGVGGMLRVSVADDGCGGADPARGTGLSGIERRLA
ncbi:MAG TPA: histidine kinase, partial [Streptosporangiaceae bacterium]